MSSTSIPLFLSSSKDHPHAFKSHNYNFCHGVKKVRSKRPRKAWGAFRPPLRRATAWPRRCCHDPPRNARFAACIHRTRVADLGFAQKYREIGPSQWWQNAGCCWARAIAPPRLPGIMKPPSAVRRAGGTGFLRDYRAPRPDFLQGLSPTCSRASG